MFLTESQLKTTFKNRLQNLNALVTLIFNMILNKDENNIILTLERNFKNGEILYVYIYIWRADSSLWLKNNPI